ncbi:MAG: twin-arginine translocase TatA/TatE family subunit [Candidatus Bathyarchaeia archaeon]
MVYSLQPTPPADALHTLSTWRKGEAPQRLEYTRRTSRPSLTFKSQKVPLSRREKGVDVGMAFIGPWEIGLILIVILILFGGKKIPELARSMGEAVKQYRKATEGASEEAAKEGKEEITEHERKTIIETAKKLGIDVEGRSIKEISEDILEKAKKNQ